MFPLTTASVLKLFVLLVAVALALMLGKTLAKDWPLLRDRAMGLVIGATALAGTVLALIYS